VTTNSVANLPKSGNAFQLFRSIAHFLRGRIFKDLGDVKIGDQAFIDSKLEEWFRQRLDELAKQSFKP